MRFLADESCDSAVVRSLQSAGHDVLSVRDVIPGGTDPQVISLAAEGNRILLTEDKDFGQLFYAANAPSPGVILFRFRLPNGPSWQVRASSSWKGLAID